MFVIFKFYITYILILIMIFFQYKSKDNLKAIEKLLRVWGEVTVMWAG